MRRAVERISAIIMATALCGPAAASAVVVSYGTEDFSVNVGLLLRAGHYYKFVEPYKGYMDSSAFGVAEAELAAYGRVFESVSYDVKISKFRYVREGWAAVDIPAGFSAKIGRQFVPFGVEATTPEGSLTCSSPTTSSSYIAPGRNDGLRFDYLHVRDDWPYEIGAAAGVYNNDYSRSVPLVDGAWRVYGTPVPGARTLEAGCSFYYGKEARGIIIEPLVEGYYFFSAPRLGFDVSYQKGPFAVTAEYMQYLIRQEPVERQPGRRGYIYRDDEHRGYFATISYLQPLGYKYLGAVRPYLRYEHFKTALLSRGAVELDYYTGGISAFIFDRILMFRADYTRIIEDENRTTNDRIASEFQVMF